MTQAIGLATALVLLAFFLVLYALLAVAVRRFLEGDNQAARGPLAVLGVLLVIALLSAVTWAGSAIGNAVASVGWAFGLVIQLIAESPLSLICLGPLVLVILFTLATPGARRWLGDNYLPLAVVVLAASFLGGLAYLVLQIGGGWGVLALLVLIGVAIGLGTRGLVFVPEIHDGPRLGEGAASSMLRIGRTKAVRNAHTIRKLVSRLPARAISKQGASVLGLIVVLTFAGWWYSGKSSAEPERPVAVITLSTPAAARAVSPTVEPATPTPTVSLLKVANTGGEGVLMRDQPSRSGKAVATLPEGTLLDIAGPEQAADGVTWRQVKEKGGKVGWVSIEYLAAERVYGTVRVANTGGEGVNLRAKPGKAAKIVVLLKEGAELKVIGEDTQADGATWRNVRDDKDNVGWVSSQFLAPAGN